MASDATPEVYDLLILVDATYSMFSYIESLKTSLPKVIAISNLTSSFARIGLLAYRDYSEAHRNKDGMLEWSGWYEHNALDATGTVSADILMATAASLEPIGGGDYPEATKTGLARAYSLMREDATTIILLYTDAPPHCWMVADKDRRSNYHAEQAALKITNSYDSYGPRFVDWVSASKQLHQGPRKAHVFCFLDDTIGSDPLDFGYYTYISTITRGACLCLTDSKPHSIAQVTVDVLLAWMGIKKAGSENITIPAKLIRYKQGENIKKIKDEKDPDANTYFWAHTQAINTFQHLRVQAETKEKGRLQDNLAEVTVDSEALKKYLPKRKIPVDDFAQRYAKDDVYKKVVVEQLRAIIETDVTSVSLNPVFGALWRAVCNDRNNPARDDLIAAFGLHVDRIANAEEKARMKNWLEESYDYAAEILEMLKGVPEERRFPCVYLDPTIAFRPARKKHEQDDEDDEEEDDTEANRPVTTFRRDELLEIGRSFAESAADVPAHIASMTDAEVPRIPLLLASKEQGWKFWKILLHVVLPGTMLAARPATVLAALAIRIGLKPLYAPACAAMMFWRDKWNNLEVPETWNSSCLGLLLDADAEYRKQMKGNDDEVAEDGNGLLLNSDRELFSGLLMYQHTGANLLTTLTADIGWTPEKTQQPVGPIMICRGCGFPRSITIMAEKSGSKCGLCAAVDWADAKHKKRSIEAQVSENDTEASTATWVECSTRTCRAQYVCYNPSDLNVRPKCHYCRIQGTMTDHKRSGDPAPTLECTKCLSKVIWPNEWKSMAPTPFSCTACIHSRKTIITVDTSAEQICKENGRAWLLRNDNGVLQEPFKRSLFSTVSTVGPKLFSTNVEILPTLNPEPALTLRGKQIRNQEALKADLRSWIQRRTAERSLCSLCFITFPKTRLLPACRRRGCHQQICEGCLNGWYSLNSAGGIINTAALSCPFCRRAPAARTLAAYGKGVHAVGDLRIALEERGKWIHAWCYHCGKARRYMERECARGAPDAIEKWKCEECSDSALERARVAEEEARQALAAADRLNAHGRHEARVEAQQRLRQAQRRRKELECPVKKCPGCKTPTQKTYGCDHMTCIVRGCKTHWCWSCGKGFDSRNIYTHMSEEHGGIYTGGGGLDLWSDYEEDDDEDDEGEY
ncbi:Nn.00g097350.m01.CDS01 [Neocucurbitaria sp. VM-36]